MGHKDMVLVERERSSVGHVNATIRQQASTKRETDPCTVTHEPMVKTEKKANDSIRSNQAKAAKMKTPEDITSLDDLNPDFLKLAIGEWEEKVILPNLTVSIRYEQTMEYSDHKTRSSPMTFGVSQMPTLERMVWPLNMTLPRGKSLFFYQPPQSINSWRKSSRDGSTMSGK